MGPEELRQSELEVEKAQAELRHIINEAKRLIIATQDLLAKKGGAMAKRRLADEYDAAQERGEVNQHGGDRKTIKFESSKLESLSPDQIHEAREIRDAEEANPGIVRATLDAALEAGEEPTKAAVGASGVTSSE